ncbi:MAG TPA: hypothetical protein DDY20_06510 [Desulfobulbaceae bacterium]|nr:hypothetical protein [Desulfobulbaceae bacterium]
MAGAALATLLLSLGGAEAQQSISSSLGVLVYPAKGQQSQQQNMDEGECYTWAKQQTGIDPVAVAGTPTQQSGPAVGGGERVAGAARGAVGGVAIGAIAGDAGEGAAIGAVAGAMLGGRQARKNKAAKEQQAQQAKSSTLQHFNKAFAVCMEGRGYTVK